MDVETNQNIGYAKHPFFFGAVKGQFNFSSHLIWINIRGADHISFPRDLFDLHYLLWENFSSAYDI